MATTTRSVILICFFPVAVYGPTADAVDPLPRNFEIEFYESGPNTFQEKRPEGHHTLRGFHCSFRKERGSKNEPVRFTVYIEKYHLGRLVYSTRWVSIEQNDVISVEGNRYGLAEASNGNTKLRFEYQRQDPALPKSHIVCVPHTGETLINKFAVILESDNNPNRIVVARTALTDVELSGPNHLWTVAPHYKHEQAYSKRIPNATRVSVEPGSKLIVGSQNYTITRIVEPDTTKGIVGWIEISPADKEVNEE